MRKTLLVGIAFLSIIGISGCSDKPEVPKKTPEPAEQTVSFSEKDALSVFKKAEEKSIYILKGANGRPSQAPFQSNGLTYSYLGTDIDTRSKLERFFGETYVDSMVERKINELQIVENNGRMAISKGETDSLYLWDKAKSELLSENGKMKQFSITIPYGEGSENEVSRFDVTFENTYGNQWKIFDVVSR